MLFPFLAALPVSAKLQGAAVSLGALILAQDAPRATGTQIPQWLDLGVTIAAIGLLGYILKLILSGGLVSRELVEQVAEKAVRATLDEVNS